MPQGVKMWWGTADWISLGSRERELGVIKWRNVSDWRRREASGATEIFGDDQSSVLWGHGHTIGPYRIVGMHETATVVAIGRAGEAAENPLLLWNEGWGKGHRDRFMVADGVGRSDHVRVGLRRELVQEPVAAAQEAPVLEHLRACRVKFPEVSFPRRAVLSRDLDKAVIEAEVVADGVLPGGPALAVVGELGDDVVTDFSQSEHLVRGLGDSHGYQGNVGVRRLDVVLVAL